MNCQDFEELSGAYALDALTSEEKQQAEAHLRHCPTCPKRLQELHNVVLLLPMSVPIVEHSPLLKERILTQISMQEAQKNLPTQNPIPRQARKPGRNRGTRLLAVVAAIVCLLLAGMTIWNISLHYQLNQLTAQTPAPQISPLRSTDTTIIIGQIIHFPHQQTTTLIINGHPPRTGTQVYQGWLLRDGKPASIGLFTVQDNMAVLTYHGDLSSYDTAAISIEPGPQASEQAPRGKIVATSTLNPLENTASQLKEEKLYEDENHIFTSSRLPYTTRDDGRREK